MFCESTWLKLSAYSLSVTILTWFLSHLGRKMPEFQVNVNALTLPYTEVCCFAGECVFKSLLRHLHKANTN